MSKKIAKGDYWKVVNVQRDASGKEGYWSGWLKGTGIQYFIRKYSRTTPDFASQGYHPLVFDSLRSAEYFRDACGSHRSIKVFRCRCRGKMIPFCELPEARRGSSMSVVWDRIVHHPNERCGWYDHHSKMAEEVMLLKEVEC